MRIIQIWQKRTEFREVFQREKFSDFEMIAKKVKLKDFGNFKKKLLNKFSDIFESLMQRYEKLFYFSEILCKSFLDQQN